MNGITPTLERQVITGQLSTHEFMGCQLRAVLTGAGEVWLFASDLCQVLGLSNQSQAVSRLDEDEKGVISSDTPGGVQNVGVVSESGMYALTLTSRKKQAKRFRKWVTSEVLPEIRRTGSYNGNTPALPQTYAEALRLAADQAEHIQRLEAQAAQAVPKLETYQRTMDAQGNITIEELASVLRTGRNRLFKWLREHKFLMLNNTPYQEWVEKGLFISVVKPYNDQEGVTYIYRQTVITPKGVEFIARQVDSIQHGEATTCKALPRNDKRQGELFA